MQIFEEKNIIRSKNTVRITRVFASTVVITKEGNTNNYPVT